MTITINEDEGMMILRLTLLFRTKNRWLYCLYYSGKVFLKGIFEDHLLRFASKLHDCNWLQVHILKHLSDIFFKINNLNLALQITISVFQIKINNLSLNKLNFAGYELKMANLRYLKHYTIFI